MGLLWRPIPTMDAVSSPLDVRDRKIIVHGLEWTTNDLDIREYFGRFGPVETATVMRDHLNRSRGFGFVIFSSAETANAVLAQQDHYLGGRRIEPQVAIPRAEMLRRPPPPTKKLFLARLPPTVTAEDLRNHFEAFGAVTDVYIPLNPMTRAPRNIAFVTLEDAGTVDVVAALTHTIHGVTIYVERATPRPQRSPPHQLYGSMFAPPQYYPGVPTTMYADVAASTARWEYPQPPFPLGPRRPRRG